MRISDWSSDVCSSDLDVRSCADGDADVGREQRRRVIDTVTHHRDALALSLQFLDLCHLVLGQYLGEDCVDVEFLRDRVCDRRGITGQQDNLQSACVQSLDRIDGLGTYGIRARKHGAPLVTFHPVGCRLADLKSTRLNSSHSFAYLIPSSPFTKN